MAVAITCRGCGAPVSRSAGFCFLCKCPQPTCHLRLAALEEPIPAPARRVRRRKTGQRWMMAGSLSLLATAAAVGAWLLAAH